MAKKKVKLVDDVTLCNAVNLKTALVPGNIEVVQEMKTVGYVKRSDMRTCSNPEYLVKKALKRM